MAEQLVKFDLLFRFIHEQIHEQKVGTDVSRAANNQGSYAKRYRNHTVDFSDKAGNDFINYFIGKREVHTVPDQNIVRGNLEKKRRIRRAATLLTQYKKTKLYNLVAYYYNTKLHFCLYVGVVL